MHFISRFVRQTGKPNNNGYHIFVSPRRVIHQFDPLRLDCEDWCVERSRSTWPQRSSKLPLIWWVLQWYTSPTILDLIESFGGEAWPASWMLLDVDADTTWCAVECFPYVQYMPLCDWKRSKHIAVASAPKWLCHCPVQFVHQHHRLFQRPSCSVLFS